MPVFSFRRVRDVSESKQSLPSFFIETKTPSAAIGSTRRFRLEMSFESEYPNC